MNPFLDLLEANDEVRPAPKPRRVEAKNAQSYDLLGQMMKGVQRKR